jgi:hypothetical protein
MRVGPSWRPAEVPVRRVRLRSDPDRLLLWVPIMISPETFSHIENIKKRAGHLWRFL